MHEEFIEFDTQTNTNIKSGRKNMNVNLIDIHTHILPYTDDGAETWEDALAMLKNAEAEGIRVIVATPHVLSEHHFKEEQKIIARYHELSEKAAEAGIKIKILLGSEIYAQPDTSLDHKIATLNGNQKYFLIEFPMNSIPKFVPEKLFEFAVDGKVPIIAHPERNAGFQNRPDFAFEYVQRGCLMQLNEGSLRGRFGDRPKTLAFKMLEHNLVHFIASDGHKKDTRKVTLVESYKLISEKFGKELADRLFFENPLKAIQGEQIDIGEPIAIEREVKQGFWGKIKIFN